ncbi:MAG: MbcA/ParS/Xre antitoxin family protein [Gallionellaceae bacterium]|nr:MbcA/ParS/Xre antitoxin family protein [Gallionellaceae bacterium]
MTIVQTAATQGTTDRGAVSKMLMQLFEYWAISTEDQLDMLGLARENRAALSRYRKGVPMSASRDANERAGHLLAIHKNLRLLFPHNRDLAYKWMSTRNRAFEGRTPVDVVRDYGFAGLLMVRSYLDRMRGQ